VNVKADWARTMRLLEERLAHHRRLDEQERHRIRPSSPLHRFMIS